MNDSTPYTVPKEPGRWRALILAALVHLALLAFFWIGIRWQSETPTTIEAEVWSPQPREAAPQPEPVKTEEAKPEPRPEPKPEPPPVVREAPKPKVEEPPPVAKPDIALEQEKKRKAEEAKRREEQEEKERLAKEKKRREEEEKEKLAKERERREAEEKQAKERKRLEDEKLAKLKQQEDAKKLEKEKAEKAEKAKKEAAEKKRKQEEEAEAKLLAKIRDEDMRRITGAGGSGDAPKAQGGRADGAYSQRIAAKIRSNIAFIVPEGLSGNPPVEYEVRLLPDGSIAGMRKLRSSGVPGFDEAVARAIERSQPYPKDSSGSVPSSFLGIHKPKDQ